MTILKTAKDIIASVDAGVNVFCGTKHYKVIYGSNGKYLIRYEPTGYCIGLTHSDGKTLNGNYFFTNEIVRIWRLTDEHGRPESFFTFYEYEDASIAGEIEAENLFDLKSKVGNNGIVQISKDQYQAEQDEFKRKLQSHYKSTMREKK